MARESHKLDIRRVRIPRVQSRELGQSAGRLRRKQDIVSVQVRGSRLWSSVEKPGFSLPPWKRACAGSNPAAATRERLWPKGLGIGLPNRTCVFESRKAHCAFVAWWHGISLPTRNNVGPIPTERIRSRTLTACDAAVYGAKRVRLPPAPLVDLL